MRIDDNWNQEALDIIKDIDFNTLVPTLNRHYSYDELKEFDLVATCTTGVDHLEIRDIPLISLKGETDFLQDVWATAEHCWALIMALIRKVPWAFDDVKQGNWQRENWQGTELRGKTLGIVGYDGRVGQQVARIAYGFGMKVHGVDIKPSSGGEFDEDEYKRTFNFVLKESDILTVHVPLNESTRGMFTLKQFDRMKSSSLFINTSRGAIIDNMDLYNALLLGKIDGAAIDVMDGEPQVSDDLVYYAKRNNNLIITPHISGCTSESRRKTQLFIAQKIKEFIGGYNG